METSSQKNVKNIVSFFQSLSDVHNQVFLSDNQYPCKFVGTKSSEPGDTKILYTSYRKRDVYEISIKSLIDDPITLNKFSPTQAVIIGAIALGDALFSLPPDMRADKYQELKSKIFGDDSK